MYRGSRIMVTGRRQHVVFMHAVVDHLRATRSSFPRRSLQSRDGGRHGGLLVRVPTDDRYQLRLDAIEQAITLALARSSPSRRTIQVVPC